MVHEKLPINIDLLKWSREEANLSLDEAVERARITPVKCKGKNSGKTAIERLQAWERGEIDITLSQLKRLAKAYRRPLLTFFLAAPPVKKQSVADFRTLRNDLVKLSSPEFTALMRRIETMHEDLIELVDEDGGGVVSFVGSLTTTIPVTQAAATIRNIINFSMTDQLHIQGKNKFLKYIRSKVHEAGIFTLLEGDLGSYHSKVQPDVFRGIALCHPKAPLIVVNPNDSKAAQLFTLLHELVHIGLGKSSVSNMNALNNRESNEFSPTESYCNNVAAEFLVPATEIMNQCPTRVDDWFEVMDCLSRYFKVSRMVIARRLKDVGKITSQEYRDFYVRLRGQWEQTRQRQRSSDGGPDPFVVRKSKLGEKLIGTVMTAAYDGRITFQDASRILGVKAGRFDRITR